MDFLASLLNFLNLAVQSKTSMALAAVVLSFFVWLLTKVPSLDSAIAKNVVLEHVATLFLAVVPAVITALGSSTSWWDVAVTAVMTFLTAVGLKGTLKAVFQKKLDA